MSQRHNTTPNTRRSAIAAPWLCAVHCGVLRPGTFLFPPSERGSNHEAPDVPGRRHSTRLPATRSPRGWLCVAGRACRAFHSRHNTSPNTRLGRVRAGNPERHELGRCGNINLPGEGIASGLGSAFGRLKTTRINELLAMRGRALARQEHR